MSIIPNVSMTNFASDTSSGWGSDEYGQAWSVYTPSGSTVIRKLSGVGVLQTVAGHGNLFARLNVPDRTDYEVLTLSEHNINGVVTHGPMIGMSTTTRGYALRMTNQRLSIVAADGSGTITEMNGVQIATQTAANRRIWMRIKYDAGAKQIRGKWWYYGEVEPSAWGISTYLGSYPINGKVGYYARDVGPSGFTVKVHAFYVLRSDATTTTSIPQSDNFQRSRAGGWGRGTNGHVWLGHANYDPDYYAQTKGAVSSTGSEGQYLSEGGSQERVFVSNSPTTNGRIRASFNVTGSNAQPQVILGLRATTGSSNGSLTSAGYELVITAGSAVVTIVKRTSLNGPATQVGKFSAPFTFAKGTKYSAEFQADGSQLAAKVWVTSSGEPTYHNYSVADSSITGSGRQYLRVLTNGSAGMTYKFDDVSTTVAVKVTLAPTEPTPPPPDPKVYNIVTGSVTNSSLTDSSAYLKATFTGDDDDTGKVTFQYKERSSPTWNSVAPTSAEYSRTGTTKFGYKTITGLNPNTLYDVQAVYSDGSGVTGQNPRTTSFTTTYHGVRPSAPTITSKEQSIFVRTTFQGDTNNNSTATVTVKNGATVVVNAVPMVVARTQKFFEIEVNGLLPDTEYTVTVQYSDPDGVYGAASFTNTVLTLGQAVELESASVRTTMTTAVVTVRYRYDENQNSSVAVQYKRRDTSLWTTVNPSAITVNRLEKTFVVLITGLTINIAYDLMVELSDPDGVSTMSPATITRVFSTSGVQTEAQKSGKQNVYRIYDPEGVFVGSWGDGPEPIHSLDENGGVTNLTVTLPRTFSQIENDKTIGYLNRVDVWCIDGEALGMGRNMVTDPNFDRGSWTVPPPWTVDSTSGADGLSGLSLNGVATTTNVMSEAVELPYVVPLILSAHVRASRGQVRIDIEAFDEANTSLGISTNNAETVGTNWQKVLLEWLPPPKTKYVRVRIEAQGQTTAFVSHVTVLTKEMLLYRGTIEAFEAQLDSEGERVVIDILGLTSYLTDIYVEFMQWVNVQPSKDIAANRPKKNPTDPANMIKELVDWARKQNPKFPIYYTSESIKQTGEVMSYTLRDVMLRDALDKVRSISPPNWHWFVDQTGCLHFRGPEHTVTHRLTIGVEVSEYRNPQTIRNLKNHIIFKGRQDSNKNEPDNYGSIGAEVMDAASIKKYGKRTAKFQDANITDPRTAMIFASGKLEELSQPEEAGVVKVLDEKDTRLSMSSLRGYNVQSFQPGDLVEIRDPENGPYKTYWDQFNWDEGVWDTTVSKVISRIVPIKVVNYKGDHVVLELSHRRPSANGDFVKMAQRIRQLEAKELNGDY